jgi:hypothetical protein
MLLNQRTPLIDVLPRGSNENIAAKAAGCRSNFQLQIKGDDKETQEWENRACLELLQGAGIWL